MPKQVIIVRKDLNMRKGKMGAQIAHASAAFLEEIAWEGRATRPIEKIWRNTGRTKIVLQAESEEHLLDLFKKAQEAHLEVHLVQDLGRTEFHGVLTYTAIAIGPDEDEEIDKVTGDLKLF